MTRGHLVRLEALLAAVREGKRVPSAAEEGYLEYSSDEFTLKVEEKDPWLVHHHCAAARSE